MTPSTENAASGTRPRFGLRWGIVGLLFASTVINYIDRQTLSVLGPHLKDAYKWTNQDFAAIVIAFRIAYTIGQAVSGRAIDWLGTRRGLSLSVGFYSVVAIATSLATGLRSFCFFRFLLGAGESANWPGATRAVSEWFPRRERAFAVAIFDSGSSIGAAVAPALVLMIYKLSGGWRPAFLITGSLGFLWLLAWRRFYYSPSDHPRISQSEREMILSDHAEQSAAPSARPTVRWTHLLSFRQTWGAIASRAFTDPVWFFITDWFALYLVARGFRLEQSLLAFWVPFVASDLGNYVGGLASGWLVRRGWAVGAARKVVIIPGAIGVLALIPAAWSNNLTAIAGYFAIATFSYAAFSTMANTLPADLFAEEAVASVSGMGGAGAGMGTILSTFLVGWLADHVGFRPALVGASIVPLLGMALVMVLVRNTHASGKGVLLRI